MTDATPHTPTPHHPIWPALLTPARSVEVRAWVNKRPDEARALRGPHGETVLHWATMSDLGLLLDVLALGLNPNIPDGSGRTPMGWLVDRLWATWIEGLGNLRESGKHKLLAQTQDLGEALWRQGGRPEPGGLEAGVVWMRTGAWRLLGTLRDTEGEAGLLGWDQGLDAIHVWPMAPHDAGKEAFLVDWLAHGSVDQGDFGGRSALWHAVQARLEAPTEYHARLETAIVRLVEAGADPYLNAQDGTCPATLPMVAAAPAELVEKLASLCVPSSLEGSLRL